MSEKDVIKETRPRMETVVDDFRRKIATVRTGRAAVSLLDTVMVDYYGTMTPLNQLASVHAPEPQMLTVQPWDQTQITAVEKAIRNVRRDGNERLKKMLKDKTISEDAERDALEEIQKLTNGYIGKIDEFSKTKEQEIMSV